ncbi:BTB/POZ domain [Trinorchestia longiramus]|nr:BTB/POZ domain [Trinorchestia longiramus]
MRWDWNEVEEGMGFGISESGSCSDACVWGQVGEPAAHGCVHVLDPGYQHKMSVKVEWQEHKAVASEAITDAFVRGLYTDLTIAAEDQYIKCHRMVLSYFSTFFKDVFLQKETSEPNVIVVLSAPAAVVRAMINFMYHGEVTVDSSLIPGLRQLAENLGVTALLNLSEPPVEQPSLASQSSRIIDAAEALQAMRQGISTNKSAFTNQMAFVNHSNHVALLNQAALLNQVSQNFSSGYQTTSRQPESQVPGEQPLEGISLASKTEESMDRDANFSRYHTAGCSNSEPASAQSPPLPTRSPNVPPLKKRKLSDIEIYPEEQNSSLNTSEFLQTSSGEDDGDSRDSDGELQIDESPESQFIEDQHLADDSEPQDLRVEPKLSSSAETCPTADTPPVNNIFRAGNLLVPYTVSSSIRRLYPSSGLHDVTIQPAHSREVESLSNNASSTIKIIENSTRNFTPIVNGSHQRRPNVKCSRKRLSPKSYGMKKGGKSTDKTYTAEQLSDSVMAVIKGGLQPVEAINRYGIPRRTFFRRLLIKRTELGIKTKSRSKPSSRSNSPKFNVSASKAIKSPSSPSSPKSPNSPTGSVPVLSNALLNSVPTSGTKLHAMLKNMSSACNSGTLKLKVEDGMCSSANSSDFIAANLQVEVKEEVGDVLTA